MRTCLETLSKACWYIAFPPEVTAPFWRLCSRLTHRLLPRCAISARMEMPRAGRGYGFAAMFGVLNETGASLLPGLPSRQRYIQPNIAVSRPETARRAKAIGVQGSEMPQM